MRDHPVAHPVWAASVERFMPTSSRYIASEKLLSRGSSERVPNQIGFWDDYEVLSESKNVPRGDKIKEEKKSFRAGRG